MSTFYFSNSKFAGRTRFRFQSNLRVRCIFFCQPLTQVRIFNLQTFNYKTSKTICLSSFSNNNPEFGSFRNLSLIQLLTLSICHLFNFSLYQFVIYSTYQFNKCHLFNLSIYQMSFIQLANLTNVILSNCQFGTP